jgi:hypothetical protein
MPFFSTRHDKYSGLVVGSGHCVDFVRAASGAPHTSRWRRGAPALEGEHEVGTVIATFDKAGRYANAVDGSSHAAILLSVDGGRLVVVDQWQGQPVHTRTIRPKGGVGPASNDADRYFVVVDAADSTLIA